LIAGFLDLILINIGSTFSTFFYFRRAQRVPAEKTSKDSNKDDGMLPKFMFSSNLLLINRSMMTDYY
jgi:hypothetical protein